VRGRCALEYWGTLKAWREDRVQELQGLREDFLGERLFAVPLAYSLLNPDPVENTHENGAAIEPLEGRSGHAGRENVVSEEELLLEQLDRAGLN